MLNLFLLLHYYPVSHIQIQNCPTTGTIDRRGLAPSSQRDPAILWVTYNCTAFQASEGKFHLPPSLVRESYPKANCSSIPIARLYLLLFYSSNKDMHFCGCFVLNTIILCILDTYSQKAMNVQSAKSRRMTC